MKVIACCWVGNDRSRKQDSIIRDIFNSILWKKECWLSSLFGDSSVWFCRNMDNLVGGGAFKGESVKPTAFCICNHRFWLLLLYCLSLVY